MDGRADRVIEGLVAPFNTSSFALLLMAVVGVCRCVDRVLCLSDIVLEVVFLTNTELGDFGGVLIVSRKLDDRLVTLAFCKEDIMLVGFLCFTPNDLVSVADKSGLFVLPDILLDDSTCGVMFGVLA